MFPSAHQILPYLSLLPPKYASNALVQFGQIRADKGIIVQISTFNSKTYLEAKQLRLNSLIFDTIQVLRSMAKLVTVKELSVKFHM